MPQVTIKITPDPGDIVHATAVVESPPTPVGEDAKGEARGDATESTEHKFVVHEGVPDTFTLDLKDNQKIMLEMAVKENIVYDKEQCAAVHVPIEGADERPPTDPPPLEATPVAEGQGGEMPPYTGDQDVNQRINELRP